MIIVDIDIIIAAVCIGILVFMVKDMVEWFSVMP